VTKLLIASSNPGKLLEMQAVLESRYPAGTFELLRPVDLGLDLDVPEEGETYAENAAYKARAYAFASGLHTLADDSGLEVASLDGAPGLHSARFGVEEANGAPTDATRRAHLLRLLADKPRPWKACFICTVAVADPDGTVQFAVGEVEGEIIPDERGSTGFGYDPLFYIPELGQTTAELGPAVKNQISHRANALRNAFPILDGLLGKTG